jgi:hypothetical protein
LPVSGQWDAQVFDSAVEFLTRPADSCGSACDVPARRLQGGVDHAAFERSACGRGHERLAAILSEWLQVLRPDRFAIGPQKCARQRGVQLPNVSGPSMNP